MNSAPKYNYIGSNYNKTRNADPYIASRLYELLHPKSKNRYLDIGCGTGNYTIALFNKGLDIIGIDPSSTMLTIAQKKEAAIEWKMGSSEDIALPNESIDGVIASLTLHHWEDIEKGIMEIWRVIKQKGRIVIFSSTPEQMKGYWLNHYFPTMMQRSMKQMPSFSKIENALLLSGFRQIKTENYTVAKDLEDHFLYCGKYDASVYFDENIRKGISSFTSLLDEEEYRQGFEKLAADIDSHVIQSIMDSYKNDNGDYLFISAEK